MGVISLAVSTDQGATLQPLLTFDQVKRIKPCVHDFCYDVCSYLAGLTLWPQQVCGDPAPDAGTDTGKPVPTSKGCGCDAVGQAGAEGAGALLLVGACLAAGYRRRRSRTRTP